MALCKSLIKISSILAACSYLSGCLLTDAFKTELLENYDKQSQLSEIEQESSKLSEQKSELNEKIEELERRYTLKEIEDNIEDYKALRPSITRLIELESDLAFVTEFLRNKEKPVSFSSNQPRGEEMGSLPELSDIVEQQQTQSLLSKSDAPSQMNFNNQPLGSSDVQVMAAAPITAPIISTASSSLSEMDRKFSGLGEMPATSQMSSTVPAQKMDAKFSQVSSPAMASTPAPSNKGLQAQSTSFRGSALKANPASNLKAPRLAENVLPDCNSVARDGRYSVHLASYSNERTAKAGWQNLENKYATVLCSLTPKLANVEVKGTPYLSLRLGPIENKATAQEICKTIQASGDYCASALYEGANL